MKAVVLTCAFVLLCGLAFSVDTDRTFLRDRHTPVINQAIIDYVNSLNTTWKAGQNRGSAVHLATYEDITQMLGVLKGGPQLPVKIDQGLEGIKLPENFVASEHWPQCTSMKQIRDQSACGSCWAFGAVEAMSDRICVALNKNVTLSAAAMTFCCPNCGFGCQGGYPAAAWQYWKNYGIVEEGCYPYPFPSCDHHIPGSSNPCPPNLYPNQRCPNKCTDPNWNGPQWDSDKYYGQQVYSLPRDAEKIMADIYTYGPVEGAFDVYEDFLSYKSGVYQHVTGKYLGGHAIKVVGWGVENGTPYWLCANSWNENWGDKGYFKILRGRNECGIEGSMVAGIPKA